MEQLKGIALGSRGGLFRPRSGFGPPDLKEAKGLLDQLATFREASKPRASHKKRPLMSALGHQRPVDTPEAVAPCLLRPKRWGNRPASL